MGSNEYVQAILEKAKARVVDRSNPLLADLPGKFVGFKSHQIEAITKTVAAFDRAALVVLDAPTGSGKTLIGETVRRLLGVHRTLYLCSSKGLQDQFLSDFTYATVLKGRSNYPTEKYPERFQGPIWNQLSCGECTRSGDSDCSWCEASCPYDLAKEQALASPLAILNTAYFLAEANGPGGFSKTELVIADEADTLEKELMNHVSVTISAARAKRYGLSQPPTVTSRKTWPEWFDKTLGNLREHRQQARRKVLESPSAQTVREFTSLNRWVGQLGEVRRGLDSELWVFTGRDDIVEFKPVSVQTLGDRIWAHSKRFLLMSASVVSSDTLVRELGWKDRYEFVGVPSVFPPAHRPIYVQPVASITAKNKEESIPKLIQGVDRVVRAYPEERVLVHCVSYELSRKLACGLSLHPRSVLTYASSEEKERVVESFKALPGSVLLAPSLERGVDLPDDLCRVQIIAKVPFPYLGDRQISARLHSPGGQGWYTCSTIRSIIQSTGRGVRHEEDWADSYILDGSFMTQVWGKNRNLFPSWWREALVWGGKVDGM